MADRKFLPRTKDGAPPFTAHVVEPGDARGRPGDVIIPAGAIGNKTEETWPRERFADSFLDAEEDAADSEQHESANAADEADINALHERVDALEARLEKLEKPAAATAPAASTDPNDKAASSSSSSSSTGAAVGGTPA